MKKSLTFLLIFCAALLVAQESASGFTGNDGERKRDPRMDQLSYVPNEIIVKFKDETAISTASRIKAAGISSVDAVLKKYEIATLERIFPEAKKPARARSVRSPQGKELKVPSLDKIYRMTVPEADATLARPASIHAVIEELKKLPEVEYVEPNYIYSIDQLQPVGPELSASDLAGMKVGKQPTSPSAVVPNDPLYEQQSYLREIKADLAWAQTTGDTTQVIAILDTGVDWTHPDLKNKIWRNWDEIPDNGIDDDGNGYIDDIRGWDYIFNDNNPMDDNSHGTHVAGIAAAEANNGIGIAGVNWHAKVMPVKVFPASGRGDVITITNGIMYAARMGATVMNMSFGSFARSLAMEDALSNAFASSILVASAGNNAKSIYDADATGYPLISYPAAFGFVLGVQAPEEFSNYDPDGPVLSLFESESLNYEMKAPGTGISTILRGNYKIMSGTSMAAPMVSGAVALYRSLYAEHTIEELWSDFVNSSNDIVNVENALFNTSISPKLDLLGFEVNDNNDTNDKDNKADAGEVINLIVQIRNTGQPASRVYAKIKIADDGNDKAVTIEKDSVNFGSIGIYRSLINDIEPFKIKINADCMNNSYVSIDVYMYNNVDAVVSVRNVKFKVYNGHDLSGILLKDTVLTADKNWVITNSLRISTGVTVTIEPGTNVEVLAGVDNRGRVIAIGEENNWIKIAGIIGGNIMYKYVELDLKQNSITTGKIEYCDIYNFSTINTDSLLNCYLTSNYNGAWISAGVILRCYINNLYLSGLIGYFSGNNSMAIRQIKQTVFNNTTLHYAEPYVYTRWGAYGYDFSHNYVDKISSKRAKTYPNNPDLYLSTPVIFIKAEDGQRLYANTFIKNEVATYFVTTSGSADVQYVTGQYWGSQKTEKIKPKYIDFNDNAGAPFLILDPKLEAPSDSAHAHVWKVLVNGKDAQDEVVDPVGVGRHRFDVYFNRPMKKDLIPQVSFGGMYPYTSIPINEEGVWSDDGKIYTVYKTIKLTTGDGVNRIRVAGAKQDADWGWEIPVEDSRFSFVIAAASSASTEFMATPGLGKVNLEWNHNDLEDGLGYNMYRMEHINDSTLTQPELVNSSLITDTVYSDFAVVPNKKYYYYYKILRTNMAETDSSRVVSAVPFTAAKGDANGDLSVNVLDVTTIVAHLLNMNPQPFIREAADVNTDAQVNILDIVGVVNLVLERPQLAPGVASSKQLKLYLRNDTLFAWSNVAVGALQLDWEGVTSTEELEVLGGLSGFESAGNRLEDRYRMVFYSMSGARIVADKEVALLKMKSKSVVNEAVAAGADGRQVNVNFILTRLDDLRENMNQALVQVEQNYPNPSNGLTTIPVRVYEPVESLVLRIVNVMGQEVYAERLTQVQQGRHEFKWSPDASKGVFLYTVEFVKEGVRMGCPALKMVIN